MIESREVYVIGNKQFVNANMAYQAADIFPTYRRLHPGEGLVKEAVESKITSSTETPQSSTLPTADIKLVTPIPYLYNISQWLIYHWITKGLFNEITNQTSENFWDFTQSSFKQWTETWNKKCWGNACRLQCPQSSASQFENTVCVETQNLLLIFADSFSISSLCFYQSAQLVELLNLVMSAAHPKADSYLQYFLIFRTILPVFKNAPVY